MGPGAELGGRLKKRVSLCPSLQNDLRIGLRAVGNSRQPDGSVASYPGVNAPRTLETAVGGASSGSEADLARWS